MKALLWFIFSGTATVSAFILPVHLWALLSGYEPNFSSNFNTFYFWALFFCAVYHGLYRLKTILFDVGLTK